MKKFFVLIMSLSLLLATGCSSGVSQETYNALVVENSKLKSDYENILVENNDLKSEMSNLKSNLEQEINDLKDKHSNMDYCFDICTWMLGRPQSSIFNSYTSKYSDYVDLETTYFSENSELTMKIVHSIKNFTTPVQVAAHIVAYEKFTDEGMQLFMSKGVTEFINIYRQADGNVIMSSYWYLDKNNFIQHNSFWTFYGKGEILDRYTELSNM